VVQIDGSVYFGADAKALKVLIGWCAMFNTPG
jgi:hypothetical protein